MGLFSKKILTCEKCGKEYEARIAMRNHLCKECADKRKELRRDMQGYIDYADRMILGNYTDEQLEVIQRHRDEILMKYCFPADVEITEEDLKDQEPRSIYEITSNEKDKAILANIIETVVHVTYGSAVSTRFVSLMDFPRTMVDMEDVFAVGFTSNPQIGDSGEDAVLCAMFTNDPYIPVFPMIWFGKLNFLELRKSKKTRKAIMEFFEKVCPNLTYPVQELKLLKKQIKSDKSVNGNIAVKDMLSYISKVRSGSGIFNAEKMSVYVPLGTQQMLSDYGYHIATE